MRSKFGKLARNPVAIVVPLVVLGLLGWNAYVKALNKPNQAENNLLYNSDFKTMEGGRPDGWSVDASSSIKYSLISSKGYSGGKAFGLQVNEYQRGSLEFKSTAATVKPGSSYFFKGYYRSDVGFSLLVKYYYKDGTSSLRLVRDYPSSGEWTTASVAFKPDERIRKAQVVYRLAGKGTLYLDRAYLEERQDGVYVPEELGSTLPNLIANGGIDEQRSGSPVGWNPFITGDSTTENLYIRTDSSAFLRTEVTNYTGGEAKWDHVPVPVEHGARTQFSVGYRSDVPVRIVAEYVLDDKTRKFVPLAELSPAGDWTNATTYSEAPPRAVELSVHVVISGKGRLDTDNYTLHDITKQGVRHYNRPLVSITLDSGWSSSYITAARILDFIKYPATFYINPDAIDTPSFLSSGELDRLDESGYQLAAHSYEHLDLTTLNARQLDRQLRLAKEFLVREYKVEGADFAPPNGHYDSEVQAYARNYYRSARGTEEGINTKQNIDVYNLKTLYLDKNSNLERLQAALDEAKQSSGWLILVYPRIEDNHPHRTTVTARAFAEQLELIRKSGIAVKTVEDALDELWAQ
jgi:peptidoglycan/xylan/chitin deacetylase (PgdA/CDA1 family)